MRSCKEMLYMVSESMDRQLTRRQHVQLKLHLFMCKFCSRARQQMQFIRIAIKHYLQNVESSGVASDVNLSPEACERIKRALEECHNTVEPEKSN